MCRSTTTTTTTRRDSAELPSHPEDRDSFKIRAFCLRLWVAEDFRGGGGGGGRRAVPGDLTLAYLPRTDGGALEVNESKVRDGAPAVVALHRVRPGEPRLLFASADRVRVGDGARFEACAGEEKVVRGVFQRVGGGGGGGGGGGAGWRMECRGCEAAVAAEVWAVGESGAVLRERVEIAAEEVGTRRRRRTTLGLGFRPRLEEIPEESDGCDRSCCCCCCCCCGDGADVRERGRSDSEVVVGLDGWDRRGEEGMEGGDWGLDMEGLRWAVDVGIWVVCLGVGLLVSRASSGSFRRKRLF